MGPILDALRELGGSGTPREVSDWISDNLQIEESKLEEVLKSGQTRFYNQVHWARQYLVWDGLLDGSRAGKPGQATFIKQRTVAQSPSKADSGPKTGTGIVHKATLGRPVALESGIRAVEPIPRLMPAVKPGFYYSETAFVRPQRKTNPGTSR